MDTIDKSHPSNVNVGRFSYSHNKFLILLACLGAIAFVIADSFGIKFNSGMSWAARAWTPQMIWAYQLLPIAAFGAYMLKRAGHRDTALSCAVIGVGFLVGATALTFASA